MYKALQKTVLGDEPLRADPLQQTDIAALRKTVQGYKLGPTFDTNFVGSVTK